MNKINKTNNNINIQILEDSLLLLGTVGGTKGVKGLLKISSQDNLEFLRGLKVVIHNSCYSVYIVDNVIGNEIKFRDIEDIGLAKRLVNSKIYIPKQYLESNLKNINILNAELLNRDVYYKRRNIGKVKQIIQTTAYDILTVIGDREYNIPFISEFAMYSRKNRYIELKQDKRQF